MKVVRGVRKDGEMGLAPARNGRASRSLVPETRYAEALSSGFQSFAAGLDRRVRVG